MSPQEFLRAELIAGAQVRSPTEVAADLSAEVAAAATGYRGASATVIVRRDRLPLSVLDASAYAEALSSDTALGQARRDCVPSERSWQAPALFPAEVQSALLGLLQAGKLTPARADDARTRLRTSRFAFYPSPPSSVESGSLCHLTTYDAWYVALAERLDVPLVTSDGKFMRASGHGARSSS